MPLVPEGDKREVDRPPMRICRGDAGEGQSVLEKKRAPSEMEPYESGANGRGRRKRRLPLDQAEGGGFGFSPCRRSAGPREEGSVRRLIDRLNMCSSSRSSNAAIGMPAMRV